MEQNALEGSARVTHAKTPAHTSGLGAAGRPRRPGPETTRLGKEIYERDIRAQVEADHVGEVVAIDVDSGSWSIGDSVIAATDRLQAQRPDANDIWLERVGFRALYSFGGGSLRRTE